jgi:type IV pilus assembly protein PilE
MRQVCKRGFTLIELMIVLAIVAILATVAFPSYQNSVRKSNRAAAKSQMLELANRQQQFLLANRRYATYAELTSAGFSLPGDVSKFYTPTITTAASPPAFTITFTATGSQATDGNLTLGSDGTRTPADKW